MYSVFRLLNKNILSSHLKKKNSNKTPAIGQWHDICVNLGGLTGDGHNDLNNGGPSPYRYWDNVSTDVLNGINSYLTAAGNAGATVNTFAPDNMKMYWASTEADRSEAFLVGFRTSGILALDYIGKGSAGKVWAAIGF